MRRSVLKLLSSQKNERMFSGRNTVVSLNACVALDLSGDHDDGNVTQKDCKQELLKQ